MADESLLQRLTAHWQTARDQGQDLSAAQLCRDCPALLPELERRLQLLRGGNGALAVPATGPVAPLVQPVTPATDDGAATPPAAAPHLPGYEILGELGRGGMGVVYRARDLALRREVAIKMLLDHRSSDPVALARFRTEAEAVARLQHPHVVQVFAWGEAAGRPYFVQEYVPGGSLERRLNGRPQPPRDAARLVLLLARAVQAAHQSGVAHRDLKPGNVLLAPPADEPALNAAWGCPKIADFGLARMLEPGPGETADGVVVGTRHYMAPEQAAGRPAGPAADVWALGVILYELLTGRPPFAGNARPNAPDPLPHHEPGAPRSAGPNLPAGLEAIYRRCLCKDPADRYPSAAALAEDLGRFLDGQPVHAAGGRAKWIPPVGSWSRRQWLAAGLLASVAVAVGAGFLALRGSGRTPVPSHPVPTATVPGSPLHGMIDVRVCDLPAKDRPPRDPNPERQYLGLNDPRTLPLRPDDGFEVIAELNRPAYVYVLWVDEDGDVHPVYPWQPGKWDTRPPREEPVRTLRRPEALNEFFRVRQGKPGMVTLVLLAADEALPSGVDLRAELGPLPPQAAQHPRATVWFENGKVVTGERTRAAQFFETVGADDPVLTVQARINERLGRYFRYTRAVAFANVVLDHEPVREEKHP